MKTHYPAIALPFFGGARGKCSTTFGLRPRFLGSIEARASRPKLTRHLPLAKKLATILCLLLAPNVLLSQNSPNLTLTDYDNTSKPFAQSDSTFCKGQIITIHGQNFKRATSGEAWDTTIVYLAGNRIWPNYINQQNGGTNDRIEIDLPNTYPNDTCLTLELWKRTVQFPDTFLYKLYDTICVGGDFAQISYGQDTFCLSDPNPMPSIQLGPNTTGSFCCFSGAPSFAVFPNTGEIPLHQGAVGNNNTFQYQSNHAFCGDTMSFSVAIQPRMQSHISLQGQTSYFTCQTAAAAAAVSPDSIFPIGGSFISHTGLVIIDSLLGKFDPQLSPLGAHRLWYRPNALCYDSSYIDVVIDSTSAANLSYPSIPNYQGVPTLCKSGSPAFPVFTSGNVGGTFQSSPAGLTIGSNGQVIPNTSQTGIYSLSYITMGPCADTVLVLPQIAIDTLIPANFSLPQTLYCPNEFINPIAQNPQGNWEVLSSGGQVLSTTNNLPIQVSALPSATSYGLCHITTGACPDSSIIGFTIPSLDTANFLYPPSNFCMGDADPYPLILGTGGGVFQPITAATILGQGGRLDITASGVGTHKIRYATQGNCPDSTDTQVEIFGSASALFSYTQSSFCQGDTSPIPTIQGTPGGLFSGSAGIAIDSTTGAIDLQSSQAGTHSVTYSLSGNCQATFTTTIQINPSDTASSMSYARPDYCQQNNDPRPLITGDTIGRFIAGAGIIFSNTDKGELDLSLMQTGGPYTVTFDIDNRCAADPIDSIWILQPDNPSFSYPQLEWCEGTRPTPDFVANVGGTFSEQTGLVQFTDSTTGEINANTSQSGGPFIINYMTNGPCPQTASAPIIIKPKPQNTSLDVHLNTSYCEGQDLEAKLNSIGGSAWKFVLNGDSLQSQGQNEYQLLSAQLSDQDTLQAIAFTAEGCSDTLSEILTAIARPELIVLDSTINVNVVGLATASLIIDSDMPSSMLYWSASDQFTFNADSTTLPATISIDTLLPTRTDPFSIAFQMVIKSGDCSNSRNVTLKALDLQGFFIPEVITPDGNGMNDTWQVTWQDGIDPSQYRIQLFNGAGGKVYEMNGLHQNFNGENLPDAVYWWSLTGPNGVTVQNGGLTVRRK